MGFRVKNGTAGRALLRPARGPMNEKLLPETRGLLAQRGEQHGLELRGGLSALQIGQERRGGILMLGGVQHGGGIDDLTAHLSGGGGRHGQTGGVGVGRVDDATVPSDTAAVTSLTLEP